MWVLLKREVASLGQAGEVKEVADGYARNYLIPQGMAVPATPGELKMLSTKQTTTIQHQSRAQQEREALGQRLSQIELTFKVKVGEQYRLYGSVTSAHIAEELSQQLGQPIDKRKVLLEEPIRHLGTYKVPIRLTSHLVPEVTIQVEREGEPP